LRAALDPLAGRMRPAGRVFEVPALSQQNDHQKQKFNLNKPNQEHWITQIVIVLLQKSFFSLSFDKLIKLSFEVIKCQL
jgi:hypothetical protein